MTPDQLVGAVLLALVVVAALLTARYRWWRL